MTLTGLRDLGGGWRLTDAHGAYDLTMDLPGDVITALERAGAIPDPYRGRNEYDLRWIAERDWSLSRRIDGPGVLVLEGLDCVAEIALDGVAMAETESAFVTHRVPLPAAGVVTIRLRSPVAAAAARAAEQPFVVPYHGGNCPIPHGNMLRKPQCDFGWDWNIALAPMGVTGGVWLAPPDCPVLRDMSIRQHHSPGHCTVEIGLLPEAPDAALPYRVQLGDAVQTGTCFAGHRLDLRFEIAEPALWWPNGMGAQPVIALDLTVGAAHMQRRIALRQIDLVTAPDAIGRSFALHVNGRPVFARGANWIPADALPGRITAAATRDLLQSAADAHMNMIRVWGGGRYEPTAFYEACDDLGLLVWQDFMFACHLYPSDEAFLARIDTEVREQVARLAPHVALWCGDNELVGALNWFEESRTNRDRYLAAYDRLNHTIERALKQAAPWANWWPSSPSRGRLDFGDGWHDDSAGDMHFWSVWHEGRDFDHYRDVKPRFCSEFGFQSYPSMATIRGFADPEDMNIASQVMESHQKNAGGNARIAETMFRYFRFPEGFENFVYLSQVQQGLAIKTAVTAWRAAKPRCMGTLYWQLNDTWPVASWSSLDYGGGWKLMHHMARSFYAPIAVMAVPMGGQVALIAVNDTAVGAELTVSVSALAMDGAETPLAQATVEVPTDAAVPVVQVALSDLGPGRVLLWRVRLPDGSEQVDHFAPQPYKALDLQPSDLTLCQTPTATGADLTLTTGRPAFFAAIEADCPGRLSWNGGLVLPGTPRHLSFAAQGDGKPIEFTIRDLHAATYAAVEHHPGTSHEKDLP